MKRLVLLSAVVVLSTCTDPVDKAAKKRIFSPEDPPAAVAAASEKLPPEDVADNPRVARRVLGMSAGEATERIGGHTLAASISWEWSFAGGKNVRLKETRELLAGPGGVNGDFIARLFNNNKMGIEVVRVKGRNFARSTFGEDGAGKFRERLRDRGMAERTRDEAFGAVRDFDQLFLGRLKLTANGTATYESRTVWKYTVSLAPATEAAANNLPPVIGPKGGADESTRRRQAFFDARQPKTLQGEVLVDKDTSVVLKVRLDGRLTVASKDGAAELSLVLDSAMSNIGRAPDITAPTEFLPDEDKPLGIAAALERFGIVRNPDGGVDLNGPIVPGPGGKAAPAVSKPKGGANEKDANEKDANEKDDALDEGGDEPEQ